MALTDLPVATFTFVLMVTLVSTSVGLIAAFLVGIPLLIGTGMIARALANFERARMRLFLDIEIPRLPGTAKGIQGRAYRWPNVARDPVSVRAVPAGDRDVCL